MTTKLGRAPGTSKPAFGNKLLFQCPESDEYFKQCSELMDTCAWATTGNDRCDGCQRHAECEELYCRYAGKCEDRCLTPKEVIRFVVEWAQMIQGGVQ